MALRYSSLNGNEGINTGGANNTGKNQKSEVILPKIHKFHRRKKMCDSDDGDEEWFDVNESNCNNSSPGCENANKSSPSKPVATNGAIPGTSSALLKSPHGRISLPVPMFSRKDFSVWQFLKQCIGKELSKITMPVIFNEPLSFVQRIVEYMEYSSLLDKASMCDDPVQRMEYIAAFAVSSSASNWDRVGKPFNPLLGETYEFSNEALGFRMTCEQVSHHPPVSAFHVDSPQYTFHGSIHPKLKFWGKSVEVTPKGVLTLKLHKYNEVYTWSHIICCVHNIIVGKLWIEHYGHMEIINHTTGHKCALHFKPSGWFGKDIHKVDGYVYDKRKKKIRAIYGKWIDAMFSHDVKAFEKWRESIGKSDDSNEDDKAAHAAKLSQESDSDDLPSIRNSSCDLKLMDERKLWQATPRPQESQQYYSFTLFALMLNELHPGMREKLALTDSRLRPDIRKLEEGDLDGASAEKHRLEEKQRAARKLRKETGAKWTPKWFTEGVNKYTGKDDWNFTGKYWDRKWDICPNIF